MAEVPIHRGWMYDRCYPGRRGLKEDFIIGVEDFIWTARQYKYYALDGGIRCPCLKCQCTKILKDEVVKVIYTKKDSCQITRFGHFMVKKCPLLI